VPRGSCRSAGAVVQARPASCRLPQPRRGCVAAVDAAAGGAGRLCSARLGRLALLQLPRPCGRAAGVPGLCPRCCQRVQQRMAQRRGVRPAVQLARVLPLLVQQQQPARRGAQAAVAASKELQRPRKVEGPRGCPYPGRVQGARLGVLEGLACCWPAAGAVLLLRVPAQRRRGGGLQACPGPRSESPAAPGAPPPRAAAHRVAAWLTLGH
jgi:hypothetical protein